MKRPAPAPAAGSRIPGILRSGAIMLVLALAVGLTVRYLPESPLRGRIPAWVGTGGGRPAAAPSPTPSPSPLAVRPTQFTLAAQGMAEWSMVDHRTGAVYGSPGNARLSNSASVVKSWIAADYLRRRTAAGAEPTEARLAQIRQMIRNSANEPATELYATLGNRASSARMLTVCRLTDTVPDGNWSTVRFSARDIARLGRCIAGGRAAGPKWTDWLLGEMRAVTGVGDFGVREAFTGAVRRGIAVKNGWVVRETGMYEVNCLAIGDGWSVGVVTRYPARLDYTYGANLCKKVGAKLRA